MDKSEQFNSISISQLKSRVKTVETIGDDVLICKEVSGDDINMFDYPTRLDAIVGVLCLEGDVSVCINLQTHHVSAATFIASMPENMIQVVRREGNLKCYFVVVSMEFLQNLHIDLKKVIPTYMYVRNNPCMQLDPGEVDVLRCYYEIIFRAMEEDGFRRTEIISGLISAFIYKVSNLINTYFSRISLSEQSLVKNRRDVVFDKFMGLLTLHHRSERKVAFYAGQLHITPKYLSGLVKEASGRFASEWIDEYVVLEAKNLLKFSDMSIQEVAYFLNFPTQTFFGKYFKRHTGMSPSEYRKM